MDRCKNFSPGQCYWLYNRSMEPTVRWIEEKVQEQAAARGSEQACAQRGLFVLRSDGSFSDQLRDSAGATHPGTLPEHERNQRWHWGLLQRRRNRADAFSRQLPITPASDILHELSQYKDFGVMTFQAEDEIAAITSSIGAAYAGALAITTTSGPVWR